MLGKSKPVPPKPELHNKIDVGFNSISKHIEILSRPASESGVSPSDCPVEPYSMVFVARGNQSSAFNCHFPQMVGAASKNLASDEKTRLIGFSKQCSERLSSSLGLARVSAIAVERHAPGAAALWEVVRKSVDPVDISWLNGAPDGHYRATDIKSTETTVGTKRVKKTE